MPKPTVLISGAGIAGLTLASWLDAYGFAPTLIDKRSHLDDQGYMIDFYGSGFDVAEKMGLLGALRARHYSIPTLTFVGRTGRREAVLNVEAFRKTLGGRHFNFMRGDLEAVLLGHLGARVPLHLATSVARLEPTPEAVNVTFAGGREASFDLVVGADGVHSRVRQLLWGDAAQFAHDLGYTVACGVIDNILDDPHAFYSHRAPGRQASVYAIRGGKLATFFIFRSPKSDVRTRAEQFAALERACEGMGWMVPELLEHTERSPEFYFDRVTQIRLSTWHRGRVVLVGDACQCLTLVAGQGASMAMAGAYLLADALATADGAFETALQAYQARLEPEIRQRQRQAETLARSFVPASALAIWFQNLYLRVAFLPGFRRLFLRQIGAQSIIKG